MICNKNGAKKEYDECFENNESIEINEDIQTFMVWELYLYAFDPTKIKELNKDDKDYEENLKSIEYLKTEISNMVISIPNKGARYLIQEIYILQNFFFMFTINLDDIGMGYGTVEEFVITGDAVLMINPDQSKDIRNNI